MVVSPKLRHNGLHILVLLFLEGLLAEVVIIGFQG